MWLVVFGFAISSTLEIIQILSEYVNS